MEPNEIPPGAIRTTESKKALEVLERNLREIQVFAIWPDDPKVPVLAIGEGDLYLVFRSVFIIEGPRAATYEFYVTLVDAAGFEVNVGMLRLFEENI